MAGFGAGSVCVYKYMVRSRVAEAIYCGKVRKQLKKVFLVVYCWNSVITAMMELFQAVQMLLYIPMNCKNVE